jgi:ribose transport system ATP-binding protein
MRRTTKALLEELHLDLDPGRPVSGLGVAHQQMVEIAKALSLDARLLIMDEPTSALTDTEIQQLYAVIRKLKQRGVSVIFISHHLEEVFEICDRGTVLRDGEYIATIDLKETTKDQLIQLMVGRSLDQQYPKTETQRGQEALRVEGLSQDGMLHDISFTAYTGEILGVAGLVGAGRTELMRAIFGADPIDSGNVYVFGKKIKIESPQAAIRAGLGLLPEDRKYQGLVLNLSVVHNISLASLEKMKRSGLLQLKYEKQRALDFVKKLRIATPNVEQLAQNLSGGNQQKVVLAKWLAMNPKVMILDEPTRGIDIGAKAEIYGLMRALADAGVAVLMISSDMEEVIGVSDRIAVMHEGQISGILDKEQFSQENVLLLAVGKQPR